MLKLLIFFGTTIGSYLGWAIGDWLSVGDIMVSFIVSAIGSVIGLYLGWKIGQGME